MYQKGVEETKKILEKGKIKWVQSHFVDIIGNLRVFSMPAKTYLEDAIWKEGIGFDGSSVKGFVTVERSDMIALPDAETMVALPWLYEGDRARIVMDILDVDTYEYFPGDPRHIARRAMQLVKKMGYEKIWLSPELEFYAFKKSNLSEGGESELATLVQGEEPIPKGKHPVLGIKEKEGYFASPPIDSAESFRNMLSEALISSGTDVKYHHHEGGAWQQEIEIKSLPDAVKAGDASVFFKYLAKIMGSMKNLLVTFMPKPVSTDAGNGMHVHMELFKNKKSVFFDGNDKYMLSQTARYFIGGILEHARGMTAITNPTTNSYKRLIPNFEAPINVAWAVYNRSALVRIPNKAGKNNSIDIEARHPDPSANPYLTFSVLIHAGMDGIKKKIDPGNPVEKNIYRMDKKEMKNYNIRRLPITLHEAIEELKSDEVIQRALGKHASQAFIDIKEEEWNEFLSQLSTWDYKKYFNV
ncbi:MAG: type I glutamate--ammonia ligase [Candidatus Thermoplasmatota archaeon]|nr:type I glutamate--ammonia ligase [Candidatus Thermoplasmatota archaeon]